MKVLIVNTTDRGGAGRACVRLHTGLRNLEVKSDLLLKLKTSNLTHSYTLTKTDDRKSFVLRLKVKVLRIVKECTPTRFKFKKKENKEVSFLEKRDKRLEMFSFPNSEYDITSSPFYEEADIINLHWVADFLDYESFFRNNDKPVIWTLHDMNPFTGGEHYTEHLLGITKDGFPLERKKTLQEEVVEKEVLRLKEDAISQQANLTVVSPSEWLCSEALKSNVFKGVNVHCIPNGLSSDIYKLHEKKYSRQVLGLPQSKKILLFVADSLTNNRKGFEYLLRSFAQIQNDDILLFAIGNRYEDIEKLPNIIQFGPIKDERLLSVAYSAADVFIIPSLMDNLPNTVLESLLCGLPVIGFPIGGIPDMIIPGFNGILADEISVDSLKFSIQEFLNNSNIYDRDLIRNDAVKKYDLEVQAQAYKKLFENTLRNHIDT